MRWATYDAVSDENRLAGLRQVTGRDVDAMLRFDRASVIVCLDADPLLTDPEAIRHAGGFPSHKSHEQGNMPTFQQQHIQVK